MDELVRWLGEQLDEDERIARAATDGPWVAEVSGETGNCVIPADAQSTREYVARTQLYAAAFDAEHIARHDPARVLREIDAKRRLVELHHAEQVEAINADGDERSGYWCFECDGEPFPCRTLRLLALPYADRPGYREEWAP
jgi:hypothetical protein